MRKLGKYRILWKLRKVPLASDVALYFAGRKFQTLVRKLTVAGLFAGFVGLIFLEQWGTSSAGRLSRRVR